jgi:K+-sensing histidine kinase KdpD
MINEADRIRLIFLYFQRKKYPMKQTRPSHLLRYLRNSLLAILAVAATSIPLFLIGRNTLGEGVIVLIYLVPVAWSANRWGQLPGICAALTAALAFDFLFIPPYYTFAVGSLESWLVLAIFMGVAAFVVERIQASLSQARESIYMYEMCTALASQHTPEAVAIVVARHVQQLFQAMQVNVIFHPDKDLPAIAFSMPENSKGQSFPERIVPIVNSWGLVGEIQIWPGNYMEVPPAESRLLQNFALQAGRAFERTHSSETGMNADATFTRTSGR